MRCAKIGWSPSGCQFSRRYSPEVDEDKGVREAREQCPSDDEVCGQVEQTPPLARGGEHSTAGEPTLNLVERCGPGNSRITRNGRAGATLDLADPLGLRAPVARNVGLQAGQQLGHDPGPLI